MGISYTTVTYASKQAVVSVGQQQVEIPDGTGLSGPALKSLKETAASELKAALSAEGYPEKADPDRMNLPVIFFWLMTFAVAATALYGPQAAALVEMFPTRIRYTAMSFPYHFGIGWVGGFLPAVSVAIVAATGNIYSGLWYAVVFTGISVVVSLLWLPETLGRKLEEV